MTPSALIDPSPDALLCKRLVDRLGRDGAHRAVDALVSQLTVVERAALAAHWPFWARLKQLPPSNEWVSFGELCARGWGKSAANAGFILGEMQEGRIMRLGMAAQNEAKTIAAQVVPLIEASPPWFRPEWEATAMKLTWPNGARALAFTPEAPEAIRSENHDCAWMSELQSWPLATREEAYSNFLFATRIGLARRIWDATPKRGHPILKRLLARAAEDPARHIIRRGTMYENPHLTKTAVEELEREYGGTQRGREELLGEMLSESDRALVKQVWIDVARRVAPDHFTRRVISIDPAVTNRAGNDRTGIIDDALGSDGQVYPMGDLSGRHAPDAWATIVLDRYVAGRCDCVVVETNKGGDLVTQNLRAAAQRRGLTVVVLGKEEPARHVPGIVYIREVHARGAKEDRAQPLATAYERGRISHPIGVDLKDLEDTLTSWEPTPGQRSPDAIDAHVHGVVELLGLLTKQVDHHAGFVGIVEASAALGQARDRRVDGSRIGTSKEEIAATIQSILQSATGGGRRI